MNKKIIAALAAILLITAVPCSAEEGENNAVPVQTAETADTVSSVGSISKVYCVTAVMQLHEQGLLDLDAPVVDYVPDFRLEDDRYKDITVRMLMNHSSGLSGMVLTYGGMSYDEANMEYHDCFLEALSHTRLKAAPGTMSSYTNDGFELLEIVVERVSGESYTDYIENHIAKPLGLENTGTALKMYSNEKTAQVFVNGDIRYKTDYCLGFGTGGIMATAPELAKFGSAMFTGNDILISQESKDEMEKCNARDKYEDVFGLGWDGVDFSGKYTSDVKLEFKGGALNHQFAGLMVAPDEQISVSVLTSGGAGHEPQAMAEHLMSVALSERGITLESPEPDEKQLVDTVPDKYLQMADIYARESGIYKVSFPNGKYMEITELTSAVPQTKQYMYTDEDTFVLMNGEPGTSTFTQDTNQHILEFIERDGCTYIGEIKNEDFDGFGRDIKSSYYLQRTGENDVSDEVQSAWTARNGVRYYGVSPKYSNMFYFTYRAFSPSFRVTVTDDAEGYAKIDDSTVKLVDNTHAEGFVQMPGEGGREVRDFEIFTENGCEYLYTADMTLINEKDIPDFNVGIHEITLETGNAKWYNIGEAAGKTIILDIPDNAAVYVYDRFDATIYSSYMPDYGNKITLPDEGKIVFIGEDGGTVKID